MKNKLKYNTKMRVYENLKGNNIPKLRIFHGKQKGIDSARYLIKCGDCDRELKIYYGNDVFLEIGGVHASKKEWKKILLPLLKDERR